MTVRIGTQVLYFSPSTHWSSYYSFLCFGFFGSCRRGSPIFIYPYAMTLFFLLLFWGGIAIEHHRPFVSPCPLHLFFCHTKHLVHKSFFFFCLSLLLLIFPSSASLSRHTPHLSSAISFINFFFCLSLLLLLFHPQHPPLNIPHFSPLHMSKPSQLFLSHQASESLYLRCPL